MSKKIDDLADWLDGKPTTSQDEELESMKDLAAEMMRQAESAEAKAVPNWDRGRLFTHRKTPWWQWQGIPAVSLATSAFAVMMVVFKVEVSVTDDAFMLSFAGKQQQQQVEQLVNKRLDEFQQNQQTLLASYNTDLKQQQKLANAELVNHVLSSNRQERKEDFVDLINYIQQQREDDQYYMNKQLAHLKSDLAQDNPRAGLDVK